MDQVTERIEVQPGRGAVFGSQREPSFTSSTLREASALISSRTGQAISQSTQAPRTLASMSTGCFRYPDNTSSQISAGLFSC
jgi:hypothetical protein